MLTESLYLPIISDLAGSSDSHVCLSALSLLTRLVTDNHELKQKLCRPMGFLRKLKELCLPFDDSGMSILYIKCLINVLKAREGV